MPATIGQLLNGLCYVAWNVTSNAGQTLDAANHTLRLIKDGVEVAPYNAPVEVDPTNCPGLYRINLTSAEMSANVLTLAGKSSTASVIIVPVQVTTAAAVIGAPPTTFAGASIWTDAQLNQWAKDAIGQIAIEVNCIWQREAIPIQAGTSGVRLPSYVRTLRRVNWRGKTLDAENWEELTMLTPATVFLSAGSLQNVESSQSRPLYYAMHPTNPYDIRLYPTPNETFTAVGEPNVYAPQVNTPSCIIDYYREPDTSNSNPVISIPSYILRRTQKAYVLWKAFSSEGKGQDLKAASYHHMKWLFLIEQFRAINEGCFIGKKYSIEDGMLSIDGFRYPRPQLPSRFESVNF